jgi:hypothetical protein
MGVAFSDGAKGSVMPTEAGRSPKCWTSPPMLRAHRSRHPLREAAQVTMSFAIASTEWRAS